MVRELARALLVVPAVGDRQGCLAALVASLVAAPGCSWILDFSDAAIPRDAAPDAPYSPAECAYGEPDDTLATARGITAADTGSAAICAAAPEDRDFYRFTVPAGTAAVAIQISTRYAAGDLDLKLYDRTGAALAQSRNFGDDELITCPGTAPACPALPADDYVFEVFPATAGAVNRYTFSITLTAM